MDRQDGTQKKPRCRDCGTQAGNVRREVVCNGFRMHVNLHFACTTCGLLQYAEQRSGGATRKLNIAAMWR